jgi:hypothetical protein
VDTTYVRVYYCEYTLGMDIEADTGIWNLVGATENVGGCLRPVFGKAVRFGYMFERIQFLKFEVWEDNFVEKTLLGTAFLKVSDLLGKRNKMSLNLTSEKHGDAGTIFVRYSRAENPYNTATFVDYLEDGFELNFACAVDFSKTNNFDATESYHFFNDIQNDYNPYAQTLIQIGSLIMNYKSIDNKRAKVLGFGAKPTDTSQTSNCFNLC